LIGAGDRPGSTDKSLLCNILKATGERVQRIDELDNMNFFNSSGTQTFKDRGYRTCHTLSYNNLKRPIDAGKSRALPVFYPTLASIDVRLQYQVTHHLHQVTHHLHQVTHHWHQVTHHWQKCTTSFFPNIQATMTMLKRLEILLTEVKVSA